MTTILASNLAVGYGRRAVASGIDLRAENGEVIALLGRNGAGKSTLLRTLCGEQPALGGSVEILGRPIGSYSLRERAAALSVVTTEKGMADDLKVREVVALGRHPFTGLFGRLSRADNEAVERAMLEIGIGHKADCRMQTLSDGERQKALIARALAQDTPLTVLDEPFAFLDVASRVEILAKLTDLASRTGKTFIFSSHDVAQALRMVRKVWMMLPDGAFVSDSPQNLIKSNLMESLFANPAVRFDPVQNDYVC